MPLPHLFKRRSVHISDPAAVDAAEQQARARARRRLIGAAVLLVVGVLAFPLLFETQPRPVPVDIPMVIPPKDGAAPLTLPPRGSRATSGLVDAAPAASTAPVAAAPAASAAAATVAAATPPTAVAPAPVPAPTPVTPAAAVKPETKPETKPEAKAPVKAEPKAEPRPAAKAETKPEAKAESRPEPKADTKGQRFVIQVGAFADDAAVREVRQKVERLGLKTYTQDVDVQGARRVRVRVGPFESAAEANKALASLKAAKLPGAVLTL